jgi:hypothetical protein
MKTLSSNWGDFSSKEMIISQHSFPARNNGRMKYWNAKTLEQWNTGIME